MTFGEETSIFVLIFFVGNFCRQALQEGPVLPPFPNPAMPITAPLRCAALVARLGGGEFAILLPWLAQWQPPEPAQQENLPEKPHCTLS